MNFCDHICWCKMLFFYLPGCLLLQLALTASTQGDFPGGLFSNGLFL